MAGRKGAANIPQLIRADPVASAHISRRGRYRPEGQRITEKDRVWLRALEPDWLPSEADLNELEFEGLEELRSEQTRLLGQRTETSQLLAAAEAGYRDEDQHLVEHFQKDATAGTESEDNPRITDRNTRESHIQVLQAAAEAANRAAVEWAKAAVERVQDELVPQWEATLAESRAEIRSEIEQLQRQIEGLTAELSADDHLQHWLRNIKEPLAGTAVGFGDIHFEEPPKPVVGPMAQALLRKEMIARGLADPGAVKEAS